MSAIIKAGAARQAVFDGSSFHLRDLLAEAQTVVATAHAEAREIVTRARTQAEADRAAARAAGYEAGHAEGVAAGRTAGHDAGLAEARKRFGADHAQLCQVLQKALDGVSAQRVTLLHDAERDVLDLALDIARRVTHLGGRLHRDVAVENLKAALQVIAAPTRMTLHVHPQDLETLQTFAAELSGHLATLAEIRVVGDEALAPGSVIVDTPEGRVDASLEQQLQRIAAAMTATELQSQS